MATKDLNDPTSRKDRAQNASNGSGPRFLRGQTIRFVAVGLTSSCVTIGVFQLLYSAGLHHSPSSAIAWLISLAVNFTLNRGWTFAAQATDYRRELRRFVITGLLAAGANAGLVAFFVDGLGLPGLPGELATAAVIAPVTFLVSRYWIFAAPR